MSENDSYSVDNYTSYAVERVSDYAGLDDVQFSDDSSMVCDSIARLFQGLVEKYADSAEELKRNNSFVIADREVSLGNLEIVDRADAVALVSTVRAISEFPLIGAALHKEGGSSLMKETLSQLGNPGKAGEAKKELQSCLGRVKCRLERAEQSMIAESVSSTLKELAFHPKRLTSSSSGSLIICGEKEDGTSIFIEHNVKNGSLNFDMAGFAGNACVHTRNQFLDRLRRQGIRLKPIAARRHGNPSGGALVKKILGEHCSTEKQARRAEALRQTGRMQR